MALIRHCDRCEKPYDNNIDEVNGGYTTINGMAFIHVFDSFLPHDRNNKIVSGKDLCPECLDKLDRFIRGEDLYSDVIKNGITSWEEQKTDSQ